jgi:alcohol dehydrogenase class IV
METNLRALQERAPGSGRLECFTEAARLLTGNPAARAEDGLRWVERLTAHLHIPPLSRYGLRQEEMPEITLQAQRSSSMKGNPIALTDDEICNILEKAL